MPGDIDTPAQTAQEPQAASVVEAPAEAGDASAAPDGATTDEVQPSPEESPTQESATGERSDSQEQESGDAEGQAPDGDLEGTASDESGDVAHDGLDTLLESPVEAIPTTEDDHDPAVTPILVDENAGPVPQAVETSAPASEHPEPVTAPPPPPPIEAPAPPPPVVTPPPPPGAFPPPPPPPVAPVSPPPPPVAVPAPPPPPPPAAPVPPVPPPPPPTAPPVPPVPAPPPEPAVTQPPAADIPDIAPLAPDEPESPPGVIDPHQIEPATARLSPGARRSGQVATGILSVLLNDGEMVQAMVQGRYQNHDAVAVLTDKRIVIVNDHEYLPDVRYIELASDLVVQGWQDDHSASLVFVTGGFSITVSQITDRPLAQEMAHVIRERVAGQAS